MKEAHAEWKLRNEPRSPPEISRSVGQVIGPALGPAFDVTKPWSMHITAQGITVEAIPHEDGSDSRDEPEKRKHPRA